MIYCDDCRVWHGNSTANCERIAAQRKLDAETECALDLKRAWGQEKRDQLAAGASQKTIDQIDGIIESILDDIRNLNRQRMALQNQ